MPGNNLLGPLVMIFLCELKTEITVEKYEAEWDFIFGLKKTGLKQNNYHQSEYEYISFTN